MYSLQRWCKRSLLFILAATIALALLPARSAAQDLELDGGYSHNTGDFGLDGFTIGAGWWMAQNISLDAEYDGDYDNSRVGTFEFTSVGAIASKSHLQNFLIGPRFYFATQKIDRRYRVRPFGEAQFGVSHLKETIQEGVTPAATNSDSAFSWLLGGGADYRLADHWIARGNLGLLRTHFANEGQSRLRLVLSIAYTFGEQP